MAVEEEACLTKRMEKQLQHAVDQISWSEGCDLIAVSDPTGNVHFYKPDLNPEWTFRSPTEGRVSALAWRPDGKVIAIVYDTSCQWSDIDKSPPRDLVYLVRPFDRRLEHHFAEEGVRYVTWMAEQYDRSERTRTFVADVDVRGTRRTEDRISLLMMALSSGVVKIFLFGVYRCFDVDVRALLADMGCLDVDKPLSDEPMVSEEGECYVLSLELSDDLRTLTIVVNVPDSEDCRLYVLSVDTQVFAERAQCAYTIATYRSLYEASARSLHAAMRELSDACVVCRLDFARDLDQVDMLALLTTNRSTEKMDAFLASVEDDQWRATANAANRTHDTMLTVIGEKIEPTVKSMLRTLLVVKGLAKKMEHMSQDVVGIRLRNLKECTALLAGFQVKINEITRLVQKSALKYELFFTWFDKVVQAAKSTGTGALPDNPRFTDDEIALIIEFLCEIHEKDTPASTMDILRHNLETEEGPPKFQVPWRDRFRSIPDTHETMMDSPQHNLETAEGPPNFQVPWRTVSHRGRLLVLPMTLEHAIVRQVYDWLRAYTDDVFDDFDTYADRATLTHRTHVWTSSATDRVAKLATSWCAQQLLIAFTDQTNNAQYLNITKMTENGALAKKASLFFPQARFGNVRIMELCFCGARTVCMLCTVDGIDAVYIQADIDLMDEMYDLEERLDGTPFVRYVLTFGEAGLYTKCVVNSVQHSIAFAGRTLAVYTVHGIPVDEVEEIAPAASTELKPRPKMSSFRCKYASLERSLHAKRMSRQSASFRENHPALHPLDGGDFDDTKFSSRLNSYSRSCISLNTNKRMMNFGEESFDGDDDNRANNPHILRNFDLYLQNTHLPKLNVDDVLAAVQGIDKDALTKAGNCIDLKDFKLDS